MKDVARRAKRLKILGAVTEGYRLRHINKGLWRLPDCDGSDDFVIKRIDDGDRIGVFEPDVKARTVARRPQSMRQVTHRDSGHFLEIISPIDLDLIKSPNRDVGELPVAVPSKVDMIGDRARVDRLEQFKWLPGFEYLDLASILQRKPNLITVWCRGDVRAEGRILLNASNDLVTRGRDRG